MAFIIREIIPEKKEEHTAGGTLSPAFPYHICDRPFSRLTWSACSVNESVILTRTLALASSFSTTSMLATHWIKEKTASVKRQSVVKDPCPGTRGVEAHKRLYMKTP